MESKCNFIDIGEVIFENSEFRGISTLKFSPKYETIEQKDRKIKYIFIEDNGVFKYE